MYLLFSFHFEDLSKHKKLCKFTGFLEMILQCLHLPFCLMENVEINMKLTAEQTCHTLASCTLPIINLISYAK